MGTDRDLAWWVITTWVPRWKLQLVTAAAAILTGLSILMVASILLEVYFPTETTFFTGGRRESEETLPAKSFVQGFLLPLGALGGLAAWMGSQLVLRRALRLSRPLRLNPRLPHAGEYAWLLSAAFVTAVGLGISVGLLSGLGSVGLGAFDRALTDGLQADVVDSEGLSAALQVVLVVGLGMGLPAGLVVGVLGLWSTPDGRTAAASPWSTYVGDRRARAAISLIGGGAVGLSLGLIVGVLVGVTPGLVYGAIAGVAVALLGRLLFGVASALRAAEFILKAPRLMRLLEDALDREVLRRAGAVYQFRHADLQDHLARTYQQQPGVSPLLQRRRVSGERWLPRRWRRPLVATLAGVVVLATAVAVTPVISALLAPDHVTLTDTPVDNLAFSPDGSVLVCSGDLKSVVWDVATGQRLGTFPGQAVGSRTDLANLDPSADELALSPDGSRLATAEGPFVRWWDVSTEENVKKLRLAAGVEVLGFSPDRKFLAAIDAASGFVSLWDASSGDITGAVRVWSAGGSEDHRLTLAFSPDGRSMVTSVHTSDTRIGRLSRVWSVPKAAWVTDLPGGPPSFSPDGEILAVSDEGGLNLHDATSFAFRARIRVGGDVTLGPGNVLATGDPGVGSPDRIVNEGGELKLWERDSEVLMRTLDSQPDKLLTWLTTFDPDGARVATGWAESGWNLDTYLLVWDVTGDQAPQRLGRRNRELHSMTFSEDGRTLATGWGDRRVRIWTLAAR
jgi:WD40 repeat protein